MQISERGRRVIQLWKLAWLLWYCERSITRNSLRNLHLGVVFHARREKV